MLTNKHSNGRIYRRAKWVYRVACVNLKCRWRGNRRTELHSPCPRCMGRVEKVGEPRYADAAKLERRAGGEGNEQ